MEVPGIRRVRSRASAAPPRSRRSSTRRPTWSWRCSRCRTASPRSAATCRPTPSCTVERLTPAVFPVFILSLTGHAADRRPQRLRQLRRASPELARVPGAGTIEVLASDTREIEVVLDPAKLTAADLTVRRRRPTRSRRRTSCCRSAASQESGQQHLALASGLWTIVDDIAARAGAWSKNGATIRVVATSARSRPARPIARCSSPATAATPCRSASRSRSAPTSSTSSRASTRRSRDLAKTLPAGITISRVYDLAEFVAEVDRQRARRDPDRRLPRRSSC